MLQQALPQNQGYAQCPASRAGCHRFTSNKLTFRACYLPAGLCITRVSIPCLPGILQLTALTSLRSLSVDVTFIDDAGYCDTSCRGPVRVWCLGTAFKGVRAVHYRVAGAVGFASP